jgi:plastocyanin
MRLNQRSTPIAASALAIFSIVGATAIANDGDRGASTSASTVSVRDNRFSPKSKTVADNTRVVWKWRGDNDHDVKFTKVPRGASKRGSRIKTSGEFGRTFSMSGTYRYICSVHIDSDNMRGTLKVE